MITPPSTLRHRRDDGQFTDTTLDRVAVEDVVAGLPGREFRSYKGRQHYSGWYLSATLARLVVYESRLELAWIMLADFDPGVAALVAQPFLLTGRDGGRARRHVPDVAGAHLNGEEHVQAAQVDRAVESHASIVGAWVRRNCRHADREQHGAGGIRSRFSTLRTVDAPTR